MPNVKEILEELVIGKQIKGSIGAFVSREEKQRIFHALTRLRETVKGLKKNMPEVPVNLRVLSHDAMADILHERSKIMGRNQAIDEVLKILEVDNA